MIHKITALGVARFLRSKKFKELSTKDEYIFTDDDNFFSFTKDGVDFSEVLSVYGSYDDIFKMKLFVHSTEI